MKIYNCGSLEKLLVQLYLHKLVMLKILKQIVNIHDHRITVTMVLAPIQLSMWLTGSILAPESRVLRLAVVITHR